MDRYSRLAKNSAIFAIANLGSHLITFILVRFYTELLTTAEYGLIDSIVTTSSMLIPFLTIAIVEAVLRFSIDDNKNRDIILTNGLTVAIIGSFVFVAVGQFALRRTIFEQYYLYLSLLISTSSISSILAQFVRGTGKVTVFAIGGIVKTISLIILNLCFLLLLRWGVKGYLISTILSEVVLALYLIISAKLWRDFRLQFDIKILKLMVLYSLPLMPNSLSWWAMNASDKYAILAIMGTSANGIYAIAHKIPTLINLCNNIFFQAWQLSAVQEASSETKTEFYTNVFSLLSAILLLASSVLILFIKPITSIMVASSYSNAWKYMPYLIIAMVFSAFSSFLGTNYVAMKKTKGALKTSLCGAIFNIILNILLIKPFGINGAAFATMLSFAIVWVYRAYDTREFVSLRYDSLRLSAGILVVLTQAFFAITEKNSGIVILCSGVIAILYIKQFYIVAKKICYLLRKKVTQ